MSHAVEITLNPHKHRFEAHLNGELVGKLVYKEEDDVMSLVSTEVPSKHGGKGIGGSLVQYAFEAARESGDTHIKPVCPFVVAWAKKHPEYDDILV